MKRSLPRISRDSILFFAGLSGIGWETFAQNAERPTLLIMFGAMVGLPAFLHADESRRKGAEPPKSDPTESEPDLHA